VKESDVLLQIVTRRVIEDAPPMIVVPSAAAQIDLVRLVALRLVLVSHRTTYGLIARIK